MTSQKRAKARGAADPAPLDPEARARLESQVAGVMRALETEVEPAALMTLVTPDGGDPDWDAHLMAALGGLSHPAIPPLLAALFGRARDKVRRKALKKTLHRLQTRGVAISADLLPREEVSYGAPRPGAAKVFVSPIFGAGESYVILEAPPEIMGGNFLVARVSDQEGFKECVLLSLKRQQQAEVWGRFREQGLDEWFSPPPAYAVALLEEAYTRQATAPGAAQYGALREKIFQHWGRAEAAPDLEQELPAPSPGEIPRLLEHCRKLALDPLFHSFLPGPEEIAPWLAKLKEVEDSPLVLSGQQQQIRIDGVMDEATRSLYPQETRAVWARRLLTTAYYLHLTGREEDARAVRAAAGQADPNRSALAGENAFLKSLVQHAVRFAYEMQEPREPATPSGLITSPGEAGLIRR